MSGLNKPGNTGTSPGVKPSLPNLSNLSPGQNESRAWYEPDLILYLTVAIGTFLFCLLCLR